MLGSWVFCLCVFCNGVVAQWNNGVEWFTTHYDASWDSGTTTVMSSGQALKLLAHPDQIMLYGFSNGFCYPS
jgi:predicted esterase